MPSMAASYARSPLSGTSRPQPASARATAARFQNARAAAASVTTVSTRASPVLCQGAGSTGRGCPVTAVAAGTSRPVNGSPGDSPQYRPTAPSTTGPHQSAQWPSRPGLR